MESNILRYFSVTGWAGLAYSFFVFFYDKKHKSYIFRPFHIKSEMNKPQEEVPLQLTPDFSHHGDRRGVSE